MTESTFGTEMDVDTQSTFELMKLGGLIKENVGVVSGGGVVSIALAYFGLIKAGIITRPKIMARQEAFISQLEQHIERQDKAIAEHSDKFDKMGKLIKDQSEVIEQQRKYIDQLRSELAKYRGVETEEIPQPEDLK